MENIILFLKNFFHELRFVDFTKVGELLGITNVEIMIRHVNQEVESCNEKIKLLQEKHERESKRESVCQFTLEEIAAQLAVYQLKLKNRLSVIEFLKKQLDNTKKSRPVIPILRHKEYFQPGEDMMLYIGLNSYKNVSLLTENKWLYGKYSHGYDYGLGMVSIFFPEAVYYYQGRDHYEKGHRESFVLLKPWEYEAIVSLMENGSDESFLTIFFSNSQESCYSSHRREKSETVRAAFEDRRIEKKSPEQLVAENRATLLKAIEVAYRAKLGTKGWSKISDFLFLEESLKMARLAGIFSLEELESMLPKNRREIA